MGIIVSKGLNLCKKVFGFGSFSGGGAASSKDDPLESQILKTKNAERELQQSQEQIKSIMETVTGFVIYRLARNEQNPYSLSVQFVSPSIIEIMGPVDPKSFETWFANIHPEELDRVIQANARAFQTMKFNETMRTYHQEKGEWRWIQAIATGIPGEDGRPQFVNGIIMDITQRMEAESARGRSEARLKAILNAMPDLLFRIDAGGIFLDYYEGLGLEASTRPAGWFVGKNIKDVFPEWSSLALEHIRKALASGELQVFEYETGSGEGGAFFEARLVPSGKDEVVYIIRDITERKKSEQQARTQQERLIQADKMISLGILISGVAHEINNPNHFIMINSSILLEAWQSVLPVLDRHHVINGDFQVAGVPYSELRDHILELCEGITEGSERIMNIVKSLKDYARQGATDLDQEVNINDVLKATLNLLANQLRKSTTALSVVYGSDLPVIKGNFQRLEQVMVNLIQNACEALKDPSQGIHIVTYYKQADGGRVVVEVKDEGGGIPAEDIKHVMDPFFTSKRDQGGTGLGLSVSTGIVKQHGGILELSSEPGKGTKAVLFLPAQNKK